MRRPPDKTIVEVRPCAWCGEPLELTKAQVKRGVKCHRHTCAIRWSLKHAPRSRNRAQQANGRRLGKQRGQIVRLEAARETARILMEALIEDEHLLFRPDECAKIERALLRAYSRGYRVGRDKANQKRRRRERRGVTAEDIYRVDRAAVERIVGDIRQLGPA